MFDDIDRIESMTPEEYREALYYLKHPDKYEGDYVSFREKLLDFGSLPDVSHRIFAAQYREYIKRKQKKKRL